MSEPDGGWSDRDRPADPDEMGASEDRGDGLIFPEQPIEGPEPGTPLRRPTERKPE